ncbi:P-loop containing nucleoside triphosphate hydrolase protein [Hesseltinella vesiculosa]|uniref:P-loop containing nucleoside triphosphate hydrolase protein n=1 Tax=Hesseltinella vesiculosa TaxID=101127 RepID=A0A1X2GVY1_9FUNG|nr:P-loop containing nucleoside triphosphate hydrolase protein [Hesseltinella vesiculosa]
MSWWSFATAKKDPDPAPLPVATQPMKAMNQSFRRGVQYNMKVVIRGDVMTGKSTLFHRLQGSDYTDQYISTSQIQVENIPWHYKDSNDMVKVEVWDVVDKAHNQPVKKDTGIKLEHSSTPSPSRPSTSSVTSTPDDFALDASTVNVYRNAHAAMFVFDVTKAWTFDYVERALADVPLSMAVLVLGNFADKVDQRTVTAEQIHATLYHHNKRRIDQGAIKPNLIRYVETSLMSGLGLSFIYEYLGVPFLQLLMETLKKQLELKAVEIVDLLADLDQNQDVPEILHRRRGQDNFDQPSDDHPLGDQHDEMKLAWEHQGPESDQIGMDHSFYEENAVQRERERLGFSATPPPPTAPAIAKDAQDVTLPLNSVPPMVDPFDSGLVDDWFDEDDEVPAMARLVVNDDSEEDGQGVTMLRDQDVPLVEYYQQGQRGDTERTDQYCQDDPSDKEDDNQAPSSPSVHMSGYAFPMSTSMDQHVWSSYQSQYQAHHSTIPSDSDDDEPRLDTFDLDASFLATGIGQYEEIGTSADNPWDDAPAKDKHDPHPKAVRDKKRKKKKKQTDA